MASRKKRKRHRERLAAQAEATQDRERHAGWGSSAPMTHKDVKLVRHALKNWKPSNDTVKRVMSDLVAEAKRTKSDWKFIRILRTINEQVSREIEVPISKESGSD